MCWRKLIEFHSFLWVLFRSRCPSRTKPMSSINLATTRFTIVSIWWAMNVIFAPGNSSRRAVAVRMLITSRWPMLVSCFDLRTRPVATAVANPIIRIRRSSCVTWRKCARQTILTIAVSCSVHDAVRVVHVVVKDRRTSKFVARSERRPCTSTKPMSTKSKWRFRQRSEITNLSVNTENFVVSFENKLKNALPKLFGTARMILYAEK